MKALLVLALILTWAGLAHAADVTLQWTPNTETDLAGYRAYQATTPGGHTFGPGNEVAAVPAGTVDVTLTVPNGTYYWVVTALDGDDNESGPSNEVTKRIDTTAPAAPENCFLKSIVKN